MLKLLLVALLFFSAVPSFAQTFVCKSSHIEVLKDTRKAFTPAYLKQAKARMIGARYDVTFHKDAFVVIEHLDVQKYNERYDLLNKDIYAMEEQYFSIHSKITISFQRDLQNQIYQLHQKIEDECGYF